MNFLNKLKNKKTIPLLIFIILAAGISSGGVACNKNSSAGTASAESSTKWTCGMHPEVILDEPGQCPICGMNLVPLETGGGSAVPEGERKILYWVAPMDPTYVRDEPGKSPMGMDLVPVYEDEVMGGAGVTIDPSIIQSIGVRYAQVVTGPIEKSIRASAHVDYDEDNYVVLSTRTDGWIEKLYITSPGNEVSEGDPLFDFYSPTLYSAQEELIIATRMGDSILASAAAERLRLLGISDSEIAEIKRTGSKRALTIVSPMDGIVISIGSDGSGGGGISSGSSGASGGGMSGMGGSPGSGGMGDSGGGMSASTGGGLREGDYISSGTSVFSIANLSEVWVYAHVYEDELQYVSAGLPVKLDLDYLPGEIFEGVVEYVYPYLDRQTRDIKIRMAFDNSDGRLMPGMFGTVRIENRLREEGLLIPREAVIYSGDSRVVFVSLSGGRFAPQAVTLGASSGDDMVEVLSGLVVGQTLVTSAQFLLDSESRLKEALNKMLAGGSSGMEQEEADQHDDMAMESGWPGLAPDDPNAKFKCPMPDDNYYIDEDGDCPICGMHLEPHDPVQWAADHTEESE
ncbi:MAG TPA: efflux RND transporter periplasmic adaptor subunit [bacterium]|jgi:Cu(I)/Ag(I) efflux system membrane fusion protein/cobalt-zinc-cadmium efflux system membrane fusion protein